MRVGNVGFVVILHHRIRILHVRIAEKRMETPMNLSVVQETNLIDNAKAHRLLLAIRCSRLLGDIRERTAIQQRNRSFRSLPDEVPLIFLGRLLTKRPNDRYECRIARDRTPQPLHLISWVSRLVLSTCCDILKIEVPQMNYCCQVRVAQLKPML